MWKLLFIFLLSSQIECKLESITFQQKLDHFDVTNGQTFPQRYYIFDDFWNRPKGPVFLYLGLASSLSSVEFTAGGVVTEAAKMYGALLVGIEHRYYGRSLNDDMLNLEKLKFLTMEQALQDYATIQEEVNVKLETTNNTWIVFGASYSGVASVLYRQKYPHLVAASVSSSAPVGWTFKSWKYWTNVGWQLANATMGGSPACYKAVYDAYAQADSLIFGGKYAKLKSDFNFCESTLDLRDFRNRFSVGTALSGPLGSLAYYNHMVPGISYRDLVCPLFTNKSLSNSYEALKSMIAMNQKG